MGYVSTEVTWACDRCGRKESIARTAARKKTPIESVDSFLPPGWTRPDIIGLMGRITHTVDKNSGLAFCSDRCSDEYKAAFMAAEDHLDQIFPLKFAELLKSPVDRLVEQVGDV